MTNTEIKDYIKAKYQEVDGYIDMIITHNTNDLDKQDIVFKKLLGVRTALDNLNAYLEYNGDIDFLQKYIEKEYQWLYK